MYVTYDPLWKQDECDIMRCVMSPSHLLWVALVDYFAWFLKYERFLYAAKVQEGPGGQIYFIASAEFLL